MRFEKQHHMGGIQKMREEKIRVAVIDGQGGGHRRQRRRKNSAAGAAVQHPDCSRPAPVHAKLPERSHAASGRGTGTALRKYLSPGAPCPGTVQTRHFRMGQRRRKPGIARHIAGTGAQKAMPLNGRTYAEGDAHSVHRPRCITTLYYTKTPLPGTPALSRLRRQNCGAAADGSCPSAAPHTGREPWGSRWTS